MAPLCYAAKFDPFLSLDFAKLKGSNFAIWQPCMLADHTDDRHEEEGDRDIS